MSNLYNNNRVSFQELKSRVGSDDVAYSLGYRLDRKAGVGRYFEMVKVLGNQKVDTIIVKNTNDKAAQTFFRRDGSRGDVITLIKENLNSFNSFGRNEWEKITNILSKMAHMPINEYREDLKYINSNQGEKPFDPSRYLVQRINPDRIPNLFLQRGFNSETVITFSPFIHLVSDTMNKNFRGYNIGFPYTAVCQEGVVGYEIRGYGGFKSKAAGTNSNSAAWVADFTQGNNALVKDLYFFESAFDAMAFHQINHHKLGKEIALVSMGGTFSDNQVLSMIDRFPNARLNDCFDNDLAGRVNAIRLFAVASGNQLKLTKTENTISINENGKIYNIDPGQPIVTQLKKIYPSDVNIEQHTPPKNFKDWNDCLQGKKINPIQTTSKYERDENLSQRRQHSFKI